MKKFFIFAAAALMSVAASATVLWTGPKHVDWGEGNQIDIDASLFAEAVAGQKIVVTYENATEGLEFKLPVIWNHVPGSLEGLGISGNGSKEFFLTQAAVVALQEYGLQVCGGNFDAQSVTLEDGKAEVLPGTIWTGYFWADEWKTMELYKEAYQDVNFEDVQSIRIYSEAKDKGNTDYLINVKSSWKAEDDIASKEGGQVTIHDDYAEIMLDAAMRAKLEAAKEGRGDERPAHLMFQFNKETGEPFNVTAIVLTDVPSTALHGADVVKKAAKRVVNGQLVIEREGRLYNAQGAQL